MSNQKSSYRDIYLKTYGTVPKKFDIHHLDHNHENDEVSNLIAIPSLLHKNYHNWYRYINMGTTPLDLIQNKNFKYIQQLRECVLQIDIYLSLRKIKENTK